MPVVRIDVAQGRSDECYRELIRRVSEVTAEVLETPIDRVRVVVGEVPPAHWGIGGIPLSDLREESTE